MDLKFDLKMRELKYISNSNKKPIIINNNDLFEEELNNWNFKKKVEFNFIVNKENDLLQSDENAIATCEITYNEVEKTKNELKAEYYEYMCSKFKNNYKSGFYEYEDIYQSKDYPYRVFIYGCDDASYTLLLKELKEVYAFIDYMMENRNLIDTEYLINELNFVYSN